MQIHRIIEGLGFQHGVRAKLRDLGKVVRIILGGQQLEGRDRSFLIQVQGLRRLGLQGWVLRRVSLGVLEAH